MAALNTLGKIEVVFKFRDESRAGLNRGKQGLREFGRTAENTGRRTREAFLGAFPALMSFNIMRQVGQQMFALTKPAMELQNSMRFLEAFADTAGQSMAGFSAESREAAEVIGAQLGFSTHQLIDALTELSKKGIAGKAGIAAMVPSARLARVAGIEVAEAAEAAATLYQVWGFRGEELSLSMDRMAVAARKSRLGFDELVDVITRSSTGVALAGPQFNDFLFVLTKARNISQSAAITGTQMRRAYEEFAIKFDSIAGRIGIATTDMEGNLLNLGDVLFDAAANSGKSMQELGSIIIDEVGKRSAVPFIGVLKDATRALEANNWNVDVAREKFFELRGEISGASGDLKELANTVMRDNVTFQLQRLRVAFEQVVERAGPGLIGPIGDLAGQLIGFANLVKELIAGFQRFVASAGPVGTVIEWITGVSGGFGRVLMGGIATMVAFRAAYKLLGAAIQFGIGPLIRARAANQALAVAEGAAAVEGNAQAISNERVAVTAGLATRAIRMQTIATNLQAAAAGRTGLAQMGMMGAGRGLAAGAGALGMLGRVGTVVGRFAGPIGIVASLILPLLLELGIFSDSVEDLDRIAAEAGAKSESLADEMRRLGDSAGAKFLEAAQNIEDVFKDPPAVLQQKTLQDLPQIFDLIKREDPEQFAKFAPALESYRDKLTTLFQGFEETLRKGEEISVEDRSQFIRAAEGLATVMRVAGGTNERIQEAAKALFEQGTALGKNSDALQRQAVTVQAALKGETRAEMFGREGMDEAQRFRPMMDPARLRQEYLAARGEEAVTDLPVLQAFGQQQMMVPSGEEMQAARPMLEFGEGGFRQVSPTEQQLSDATAATAANTQEIANAMRQGIPVQFEPTNLIDAIQAGNEMNQDANLNPGGQQ